MDKNLEVKILSGSADNKVKNAFYPDILPIEPGDTITWVNEDSQTHSIASGLPKAPEYSGLFFKTGSIDAQESASAQITDLEGHFAFYYFCEIHPWMTGKIVISTAPESQPETALPIATSQATYHVGQNIPVTGKVADDYAKIEYQILIYDKSNLMDSIKGHFNDDATLDETIHTGKLADAKYTLKLIYGLPTQIASTSFDLKNNPEYKIPDWIRGEAKLWSSSTISDGKFIETIQYLSKENIIGSNIQIGQSKFIPSWVKTSASWWTDGLISDSEFASALEYLLNAKIIQI